MTARARLGRARLALVGAWGAGALLWALAAGLAAVTVFALADQLLVLPREVRAAAVLAAATIGGAAFAARVWRGRGVLSLVDVALWIEARRPDLGYALVTLAEYESPPCHELLEHAVSRATWSAPVGRAMLRALLLPMAVAVAAALALRALPAGAVLRIARPSPGDAVLGPVAHRRDRLAPLVATVTPPPYTGLRNQTIEEPASVPGIEGSSVIVEGRGAAAGLTAMLADTAIRIISDGDRWRASFVMPARAVPLRIADGAASRVVILEPYPDSLPRVTLTSPSRDTVLRAPPHGSLRLAADLHDDLGLSGVRFEVIVSSGELETFTSRATVIARDTLAGVRDTTHEAALPLDSLRLLPGDVIHLRAVATDTRQPWPGRGASETRTWRIVRAGEYDSLELDAAPPDGGDTSVTSQRMLIMLAEALERRRPRLSRERVLAESRDISRDQARLRRRVADIIFMRLGGQPSGEEVEGGAGEAPPRTPEEVLRAAEEATTRNTSGAATDFAEDESPVVAVNRPLLEAYNAMWDATRELDLGEPDDALPFMRAALAAIQRAREAERVYLRGRPPQIVVDVRRTRLVGDRSGAGPAGRAPREADPHGRAALARRFAFAVTLILEGEGQAAADSLQLLRLDALDTHPDASAVVGALVRRLRAGGDVTASLIAVRRVLEAGAIRGGPGLAAWAGGAP